MYKIIITGGQEFIITEQEYKSIGAKGLTFFPSCNTTININSIKAIYPVRENVDRKDQETGILHDGTIVRRHFGSWVVDSQGVPDDSGRFVPVKLDQAYYPEISMDCVPTAHEYKTKYSQVKSGEELIQLMTGKSTEDIQNYKKRLNKDNDFKQVML